MPRRHQIRILLIQLGPETAKSTLACDCPPQPPSGCLVTDTFGEVSHVRVPDRRRKRVDRHEGQLVEFDGVLSVDSGPRRPERSLPRERVDQPLVLVVGLVRQSHRNVVKVESGYAEHERSVRPNRRPRPDACQHAKRASPVTSGTEPWGRPLISKGDAAVGSSYLYASHGRLRHTTSTQPADQGRRITARAVAATERSVPVRRQPVRVAPASWSRTSRVGLWGDGGENLSPPVRHPSANIRSLVSLRHSSTGTPLPATARAIQPAWRSASFVPSGSRPTMCCQSARG